VARAGSRYQRAQEGILLQPANAEQQTEHPTGAIELTHGDQQLRAEPMGHGITRIRLTSRLPRALGFESNCFLAGDLLIDTSYHHVGELLARFVRSRPLRAIVCTHHHEDHVGSCAELAREHGCPVYMHEPDLRYSEGVQPRAARRASRAIAERPMPLYRQLWWGRPAPFRPRPLPDELAGSTHRLRATPTPGHAATHAVLLETQSGTLFAGDLIVSRGASAVMSHENPYLHAASLRRAAEIDARRLFNGHGLILDDPPSALRLKAQRIEEAAGTILELHDRGVENGEIVRRIFDHEGQRRDWVFILMTGAEFSRLCFVRACIAHRP
jgi:glyoxylase-like metal-dependent hydrolase (beta-lactamase superfamily II)